MQQVALIMVWIIVFFSAIINLIGLCRKQQEPAARFIDVIAISVGVFIAWNLFSLAFPS